MLFDFTHDKKIDNALNIYDDESGLTLGNMFPNLFSPYKNYKPVKIIPKSNQEDLLFKIMSLDFAINDLNLYLSLHKNDLEVYSIYQKYITDLKCLIEEYESKYQVLDMYHDNLGSYKWINSPYPWDKIGGIKHV